MENPRPCLEKLLVATDVQVCRQICLHTKSICQPPFGELYPLPIPVASVSLRRKSRRRRPLPLNNLPLLPPLLSSSPMFPTLLQLRPLHHLQEHPLSAGLPLNNPPLWRCLPQCQLLFHLPLTPLWTSTHLVRSIPPMVVGALELTWLPGFPPPKISLLCPLATSTSDVN